jgi:hypothetical protein
VFSIEARLYIAIYAISKDADHNSKLLEYVVTSLALMKDHKKGIRLADENLPADPGKFMSRPDFRRLEKLRVRYDPLVRFHTCIRLPAEFEASLASLYFNNSLCG